MFSPFVTHNIYTREEVIHCWHIFKAFDAKSVKKNNQFILYYTEDTNVAVTVAALFMRHLTVCMTDTYYDKETNILYLYYGASPLGKTFIDRAIERIIAFASRNRARLDVVSHDLQGIPLFAKNL